MTIELFDMVCHEQDFSFDGKNVLFLHGQYNDKFNKRLLNAALDVWQPFLPYARQWEISNASLVQEKDFLGKKYAAAFIETTKQQKETEYLIAAALSVLEDNGLLMCVAANNAGGTRLPKTLTSMDIKAESFSKNKARCVWGRKRNEPPKAFLEQGALQHITQETYEFYSRPGIYGWNKVDQGSHILLHALPESLTGTGADFGCGYGFLSMNAPISAKLYCIDADSRALEACKKNMQEQDATFVWADLTDTASVALPALDWIIMNPPFHEGKQSNATIGQAFIKTAYNTLRRKGVLYMVANAHLPYETILQELFPHCKKRHEGNGYKVYEAIKE